jgi:sarcosine oxidase
MSGLGYDAIVVGMGGMGSATAFEMARRGMRVLGLEQFDLVHDRGSSHGQTRIIRTAYYEHPGYVPLVRRAFERWRDLEHRMGRTLLTDCGCLTIGRPGSEVVQGVWHSAAQHGLAIEDLQPADLRRRFAPFQFSDEYQGVLEHDAGFLYVEECVRAHLDAALQLGADIHAGELVLDWKSSGSRVEVTTSRSYYSANCLILTAGPWAGQLLSQWGNCLTVMRQTPHWFKTTDDAKFHRNVFPVFIADVPEGFFYGFPVIDSHGLKVARHYGAPELPDPSHIIREVTADDERPVRDFLNSHLPSASGPLLRGQVCTYTLTPDRHFILDRHPEHANVAIAAGFSGHGFKFASVVGEIMADLATTGRTDHSIDMFRITRFARPKRWRRKEIYP